jgi:hypothetical protein
LDVRNKLAAQMLVEPNVFVSATGPQLD